MEVVYGCSLKNATLVGDEKGDQTWKRGGPGDTTFTTSAVIPFLILESLYVLRWLRFVGRVIRIVASHEILHVMEHYGNVGIVVFLTVIPACVVAVVASLILRDWWMAGCFAWWS